MVVADFPPSVPGRGTADPENLHPGLWRAHRVGRQRSAVWPSGFAVLDAELPGGGWPAQGLSELLLEHPGVGEIRLLAPVLSAVQRGGRSLMLFDPPAHLCGWTLASMGIDWRQLVVVRSASISVQRRHSTPSPPAADALWALEHSLKSGEAGAVLAWVPQRTRAEALRRLQMAAQAHEGPAFLIRGLQLQAQASAAPLRVTLSAAGPDELSLRIVKRRGPPLLEPLVVPLLSVLSEAARARASQSADAAASEPSAAAVVVKA